MSHNQVIEWPASLNDEHSSDTEDAAYYEYSSDTEDTTCYEYSSDTEDATSTGAPIVVYYSRCVLLYDWMSTVDFGLTNAWHG
jgi:hypothetical protein